MKTSLTLKVTTFVLMLLIVQSYAFAQKDVGQDCQGNEDCKSGYCVTLRTGGKKCSKCDQSKLDYLTSKVDDNCKLWDKGVLGYDDLRREFGSKNEVSLVTLYARKEACKSCYDARSARENECWEGGDSGHKEQLERLKTSLNYLDGLINDKTRYNLAYNCEPDRYDDLAEDINDNCREIDQLFAKYGLFEEKEGSCSELNNLIDKCIDCREAWDDMMNNCFRNGASSERNKRYDEVKDMEKIAKETLEKRKSKDLCK